MLKRIQKRLPKLWTNEQYSDEFNATQSAYRDFDHALKHVIKAAVKLQNMCEEADHAGPKMRWREDEIKKYLADVIISVARAAHKSPVGDLDLDQAVRDRIKDKMGADL